MALRAVLVAAALLCGAAVSYAQTTVSWNDNSDNEKGFVVERSTTTPVDGGWNERAVLSANTTTYIDPERIPGACYRVLAFNDVGNSPYSEIACLPDQPPPPADTTGPTVTITNPQQGATVPRRGSVTITASWFDDSGVETARYFVNGSLLCQTLLSCRWNVPGAPSRQYTIKVEAVDGFGNVGAAQITVRSNR